VTKQTVWLGAAVAALAVAGAVFWGVSGGRIVEGPAMVPQAGVLTVENVWIPLLGLHPPREDPNCIVEGVIMQCPLISAAQLAVLVLGRTIRCSLHNFPNDDRNWGTCGEVDPETGAFAGESDSINRALVRTGWAVGDDHYVSTYMDLTEDAQDEQIGVWTDMYIEERARTGTLGTVNETNDAATVEVVETRVRLFGIDAPELSQECLMNRLPYPCGLLAGAHLNALIIGRAIICHVRELDDGRMWGRCGDSNRAGEDFRTGSKTLNEQMVLAGWAMANRDQAKDFVEAEQEARREKRGMWAGEFVRPADWRNGVR
jgi:endonuclease YncB( thermonuclease family)